MDAQDYFLQWEEAKYGDDSPLSDDDRELWQEGFTEYHNLQKGKTKCLISTEVCKGGGEKLLEPEPKTAG